MKSIELESTRDESQLLFSGNSFTITGTVYPENATDKTLIYSSTDESVAKVNQWGTVTAVGVGTATITVTSPDGVQKKMPVYVSPTPTPEPTPVTRQNNSNIAGNSGNSNFQTYNDPYSGPAPYIGNANSKKFHYSWCNSVSKMAAKNKVEFYSRDDAIAHGYQPCKNCNP